MAKLKGIKDIRLLDIMMRKDRVTPLNEAGLDMIVQSVEEVGEIRGVIHLRKVKGGYVVREKEPSLVTWNCN